MGQGTHIVLGLQGSSPMNSGPRGRWDRNRTCNLRFWRPNPTCRVVSRGVATCRSAALPVSPNVAECRRVSSVTGADTGGSLCSHGRSSPFSEHPTYPIRGCNHLTDGLIRRLFLATPVRSVRPMCREFSGVNACDRFVPFISFAGGFAGGPSAANFASSVSPDASENQFRSVVT
jgi:hypothetical protein